MTEPVEDRSDSFRRQLASLLNSFSKENGSDTPDFILADFLVGCLAAYDATLQRRTKWYTREEEAPPLSEAPPGSDDNPLMTPADYIKDSFLAEWEDRAFRAYRSYGATVGGKNFAGNAMPEWQELPRKIKAAWCCSTRTAFLDAQVSVSSHLDSALRNMKV